MVQSSGGDELYDMFKSQIAAMQKCRMRKPAMWVVHMRL